LTIDPLLSATEREELGHLEYLCRRVEELRQGGRLAPESSATVLTEARQWREAIERHGRYQAAVIRARALAKNDPEDALQWAEYARGLDPAKPEAWDLLVSIHWDQQEDDQAIACCTEAAGRFPRFEGLLNRLLSQREARAEMRQQRLEEERVSRDIAAWLSQARAASQDAHDDEAIALGQEILAQRPDHIDAMAIVAYSYQRMGRLDDAIILYETLAELEPSKPAWSQWVSNLRLRKRLGRLTGSPLAAETQESADAPATATPGGRVAEPPPPLSWSSIAGEFLQEHWQKLILCLAVLLIVVSSTVGAHLLLGPLLWSPVGKCALALVWTMMFAALGVGLIRWGAERAGQMMLVTTLIVVPIHFMLAGELKLVMEPSASRLVVMAIDGLALLGLVRGVSGMLVPRAEARFLTVSLLLLSAGSAITARGAPTAWGWQFAAFQAPAVVFLGTVWALGVRRWGGSDEAHRQFATLVLGLLGFAFLACLIRTGVYALRLAPALYAGPVMLGAIASVRAARGLAPYETDVRRLAGIRFGGYVLSALAFALALAAPPASSPLFSGNTLAVGLLGFALYAASLCQTRHPAFLYLAIGSLVAARIGAQYFLAERLRMLIDLLRRVLGYPDVLPWPFIALLGLILSPALALLSIGFRRHWQDPRLARHCHYIGLPLAVAACVASGFEPLAGAIVLSGYALFFTLAVWLFAVPWLTYLAIAALSGAAHFGSTLIVGVTPADQALLAAAMAWGYWAVRELLRRFGAGEAYQTPWSFGSKVLTTWALMVATLFIAARTPESISAAGAFALIGALAVLLVGQTFRSGEPEVGRSRLSALNRPSTIWAGLTLISFIELTICGLALATGGRPLPASDFGLLFAGDGLAMLVVAQILRQGRRGSEEDSGATARTVEIFAASIPWFVITLTLIADWLAFLDLGHSWTTGVVWLLGAPALFGVLGQTGLSTPRKGLVYLALAQYVAGTLDLASWSVIWGHPGLTAGWLAVVAALIAVSLWLAGVLARHHGLSDLYAQPCLNWSLALTLGVVALALDARFLLRDAYRFGLAALILNAIVTMLLSRSWRRAELTYAAVFHVVVATYLVLFSVGTNDPAMEYLLGLCAVIEALLLWVIGLACRRWGDDWARSCARALFHATVALTVLGIPLADRSPVTLVLAGLSFLLTVKSLARAEWLYATVAALGAACYYQWLWTMSPMGVAGFAMGSAFVVWALGVLVQRFRPVLCVRLGLPQAGYEAPLFHSSIIVALIAIGLRLMLSLDDELAWTAHAWLPLSVSMLALVMLKAYPRRECVHASLAFLVWSAISVIAPSSTSTGLLAMAGMVVALGLLLLERLARVIEPALCARLGVVDVGYAPIIKNWASVLFVVAGVVTIAIVLSGMSAAMLEPGPLVFSTRDWWPALGALGLAAAFVVAAGMDPEGWGATAPDLGMIGLLWIGVLAMWWLGVNASPLMGQALTPDVYYPAATAVAALATVRLGRRYTDLTSWHELSWLGDVRSEQSSRLLAYQACILAVLAALFTRATVSPTTVATLGLAAMTLGLGAVALASPVAAGLGSASWAGAGLFAGLLAARWLGFDAEALARTSGAVGAVAAAFSLWWLAGGVRVAGTRHKSG
ncbi:MAG TPA: hypothetical protein VFF52_20455, partial [Isosphaeraceae bacterium]|nr:hypothetical protein [Isosphaeraceae bacterium]